MTFRLGTGKSQTFFYSVLFIRMNTEDTRASKIFLLMKVFNYVSRITLSTVSKWNLCEFSRDFFLLLKKIYNFVCGVQSNNSKINKKIKNWGMPKKLLY